MEVTKKPVIKSIPYEEFQDNETLEKIIQELNAGGVNVVVGALDTLIDWGRSNSLWPLTFATSCCGIEFMAVCAARYDIARFGFEVTRNSPRQADVILVSGTITHLPQVLPRGAGRGPDTARRRLCARLSSAPRSLPLWHDAAAAQGED